MAFLFLVLYGAVWAIALWIDIMLHPHELLSEPEDTELALPPAPREPLHTEGPFR